MISSGEMGPLFRVFLDMIEGGGCLGIGMPEMVKDEERHDILSNFLIILETVLPPVGLGRIGRNDDNMMS